MAYVPPSQRQKTEEKVEMNFPQLSNFRNEKPNKSYADQAENWRKQKEEFDKNQRVEEYMNEYRKQKEEDNKLEQELMFPEIKRSTHIYKTVEAQKIVEPVEDGWTLVSKKRRRERKDAVNFDVNPEDELEVPQDNDDESMWQ